MSTLVPIKPATTSFNDQSHTNPSSKDLLTLFESSLLINPPYILTVSLDILLEEIEVNYHAGSWQNIFGDVAEISARASRSSITGW